MKGLLAYNANHMQNDTPIPRAERRRMMRDTARIHKMMAVNPKTSEYDRLIAHGQVIIHEMSEIQQKMLGLGYTPKAFRMIRQEELTDEWNEQVEKLEGIQERISEIEKANAPKNETPNQLTATASNRESGIILSEQGQHNK